MLLLQFYRIIKQLLPWRSWILFPLGKNILTKKKKFFIKFIKNIEYIDRNGRWGNSASVCNVDQAALKLYFRVSTRAPFGIKHYTLWPKNSLIGHFVTLNQLVNVLLWALKTKSDGDLIKMLLKRIEGKWFGAEINMAWFLERKLLLWANLCK